MNILFKAKNGWSLTKRELLFSFLLIAIFVVIDIYLYEVIESYISSKNMDYISAVWVQDNETFKNRLYTDERHAIVYGEYEALDPVSFHDLELSDLPTIHKGDYAAVKVVKQHYTRHTRVETYYVNGKPHTRIKTYYSWDTIYSRDLSCKKVSFCGIEFPYETFIVNSYEKLDRIKKGNDRWIYYIEQPKASGLTFLKIENNEIGNNNRIYTEYKNTKEDFELFVEDFTIGDVYKYIFCIIIVLLQLVLIYLFFVNENKWLNDL